MKMITATIASYLLIAEGIIGLVLPGYVCLVPSACSNISLSVCSCPLYCMAVGLHAYQCVSGRLGETAHSALDKAKSRLQTHPVYTPVCLHYAGLHVCSVSPSHAYPRPRGTGDREERGRAKLNSDTRWGKALQYECIK